MEALECIKTRRSIRKFTKEAVNKDIIEKLTEYARYSPSWKNSQTARYVAVASKDIKDNIAENAVNGFEKNRNIIKSAPVLFVITTINGRSGFEKDGTFSTGKGNHWQSFDAGAAVQTLCLSACEMGLGSVIMGIYDEEKVKEILKIPENQSVSALVALGYPDEQPTMPKRNAVDDILIIK